MAKKPTTYKSTVGRIPRPGQCPIGEIIKEGVQVVKDVKKVIGTIKDAKKKK